MPKEPTAKKEETALEKVPASPMPVFSGQQMADALQAYKALQKSLDASMPDQLMKIQGKDFRKKGYWRAIRMSFNLQVECISDRRVQYSDRPNDWGYEATYRATAPNGSTADGDGSCTHEEKSKGKMVATVHNVRSHAHTRAMNRAISNLVGFGEVSAEEVNREPESKAEGWERVRRETQAKADREAQPQQPSDVIEGIRPNPKYNGKESDPIVTFPAKFVKAPKTGKSLVYEIFGQEVLFPITHVVGHSESEVVVTTWIANTKLEEGKLPSEAGSILAANADHGDAWEPPLEDDVQF
jgi:hypothetical protein